MDRIKILDETLVASGAEGRDHRGRTCGEGKPVWIARQGNGHIVAMDGPGDPDVATGDVMFIAEVAPSR